jgi:hypothetical protein
MSEYAARLRERAEEMVGYVWLELPVDEAHAIAAALEAAGDLAGLLGNGYRGVAEYDALRDRLAALDRRAGREETG